MTVKKKTPSTWDWIIEQLEIGAIRAIPTAIITAALLWLLQKII